MKNKFLGIVCIIYSLIIGFVWRYNIIDNFLAPQMQIYLKITFFVLLFLGIIVMFSEKISFKFKITDIILLLPLFMLIFAGDGRLTTSFASNRIINNNSSSTVSANSELTKKEKEKNKEIDYNVENNNYNFDNVDFDVIDANYYDLANFLTYINKNNKYVGKTIRVRGFTTKKTSYLPEGHILIGKYGVSCCTADAGLVGFIIKEDNYKIKENAWYEVEGVLEKDKDSAGYDIMKIKIVNIKEIEEENQYVYPCYSYDDGTCEAFSKYNLEY